LYFFIKIDIKYIYTIFYLYNKKDMLCLNIENLSYIFLGWISFIIIGLIVLLTHQEDKSNLSFYKFGPSDKLIIMGIMINTPIKYIMIVLFSSINSAIRSLSHNFVSSWIINNIQDEKAEKYKFKKRIAYQVSIINIIYTWVDWLLYMNILLSQIDMLLYEICSDIIVSIICTRYYLNKKKKSEDNINNYDDDILLNEV